MTNEERFVQWVKIGVGVAFLARVLYDLHAIRVAVGG